MGHKADDYEHGYDVLCMISCVSQLDHVGDFRWVGQPAVLDLRTQHSEHAELEFVLDDVHHL